MEIVYLDKNLRTRALEVFSRKKKFSFSFSIEFFISINFQFIEKKSFEKREFIFYIKNTHNPKTIPILGNGQMLY